MSDTDGEAVRTARTMTLVRWLAGKWAYWRLTRRARKAARLYAKAHSVDARPDLYPHVYLGGDTAYGLKNGQRCRIVQRTGDRPLPSNTVRFQTEDGKVWVTGRSKLRRWQAA